MSDAINVGGAPAGLEQAFEAPANPWSPTYWGGPSSMLSAGTGPAIVTGTALLDGVGALVAAAMLIIPATATASGVGSLAAGARVEQHAQATLTGAGLLVAGALAQVNAVATLPAGGALAADALNEVHATALLAGTGQFAAGAIVDVRAAATPSGTSSLGAEGDSIAVSVVTATALLAGTGNLAAGTSFVPQPVQVDVGGVGSWPAAVAIVEGQAEIHGDGVLVASANCVIQVSAAKALNDDDEVISLAVLYLLSEVDHKT